MIETLETGITSPRLATLKEIERPTVELLAQPTPPSRHATRPAEGLAANGAAFPGTTSPRHRHTQKIPPGGNLVRIVRTFKPFPEPILLPGEAEHSHQEKERV
jgi:hypothetical protein